MLPSPRDAPRARGVRRILPACAGLVALSLSAAAQTNLTYRLTNLDGLPSAEISDLAQAPDGRIWFATRNGVAGFDGTTWERYESGSDLPLRFGVDQLVADAKGRVWCAPRKLHHGTFRIDAPGRWFAVPPPDALDKHAQAVDLVEWPEESGRVALLSDPAALHLWEDEAWRSVPIALGDASLRVFQLRACDGALYVATSTGLGRLSDDATRVERVLLPGAPGPVISGLALDRGRDGRERLWLLGHRWLGRYAAGSFECLPVELPDASPRDYEDAVIESDGEGGVVIGCIYFLRRVSEPGGESQDLGIDRALMDGGATAILLDRDRAIWVGEGRGVLRFPSVPFVGYDRRQGLLGDEVSSILELPDGRLVLGQQHGLSYLDGEHVTVQAYPRADLGPPPSGKVLDLRLDRHGGFWAAASYRGLVHHHAGGRVDWYPPEHETEYVSVLVDRTERVWIGTSNGLRRLENEELVPVEVSSPGTAIRRLCEGESGTVYACTPSIGLCLLKGEEWTRCASTDDPAANSVYGVLERRAGDPLVATRAGLRVLVGDELRRYAEGFELDIPVYSMLIDSSNRLCLGTSQGIRRWDGEELRTYTLLDGLSGQEANRSAAIEDSAGRLWFGNDRGVSRFVPERDFLPRRPEVDSLTVEWNGEFLPIGGDLELSGERDLALRFRAISFDGDGEILYRWRLHGLDEEWTAPTPRSAADARYTRLSPGDYRFEVQARSRRSEWGASRFSPSIVVHPPPWRTWWFATLCALAVAGLAAGAAILFASRRHASRLEVLVRERSAALEESERRYREMFEHNPAVQLVLDPEDGRILEANPAALAFFGRERAVLGGRSLAELIGWPEAELRLGLRQVVEGESDRIGRAGRVEPDEEAPLTITAHPFLLRGERVVHATLADDSARLALERQLREAQKLKAVGELSGGIAHDFNNLLTALMGYCELILLERPEDSALREWIGEIHKAGSRGADLVRQLLAFGRKQVLRTEVVELNEILSESAALLRDVVGEGIVVELRLEPSAGWVCVDRGQVERVLLNLALNARDAMPGGGVCTLETGSARPEDLGGADQLELARWTRLSIHDTGCGIPPAIRSRIFDPFFTTKEFGRGSGLGLSSVHGIIGQFEGTIRVESRLGQGTSFHILLPRAHPDSLLRRSLRAHRSMETTKGSV